jgi:hypothetical protein
LPPPPEAITGTPTDFDIKVVPGVIWDDIQSFNTEFF